jgi:O-acetylhomoserine/O-acetylserine sulfhydrylase-like pyridoxal-dependent enzyme
MNYSVPFEYIKQKVDVRLTKATVEVFYGGNRICSHPRLYGRFNQYSTIQEHMPPEHQKYVQFVNINKVSLKEKQITTNTKLPKATFFFSIKSKT